MSRTEEPGAAAELVPARGSVSPLAAARGLGQTQDRQTWGSWEDAPGSAGTRCGCSWGSAQLGEPWKEGLGGAWIPPEADGKSGGAGERAQHPGWDL